MVRPERQHDPRGPPGGVSTGECGSYTPPLYCPQELTVPEFLKIIGVVGMEDCEMSAGYGLWVYCYNRPAGRTDWGDYASLLEAERALWDARRINPTVTFEVRSEVG